MPLWHPKKIMARQKAGKCRLKSSLAVEAGIQEASPVRRPQLNRHGNSKREQYDKGVAIKIGLGMP